jgi:hypothetical protein
MISIKRRLSEHWSKLTRILILVSVLDSRGMEDMRDHLRRKTIAELTGDVRSPFDFCHWTPSGTRIDLPRRRFVPN